ncbi:endolytic transglycosylase MltG [Sphingosinicellaceae bacterium]|nr:endolytic transglycosylase MltG [Sphingosinicellaceae bacterium]
MKFGRAASTVLLLLALIGVPVFLAPWFGHPDRPLKTVDVVIKAGATLADAANVLEDAGLVRDDRQFRVLARLFGGSRPVKAGVYRLARGDAWGHYLHQLQVADVVSYRVTIPEGWPAVLVADRLNAETRLTGTVAVPAEGSVLPDTYDFQSGETRAAVVKRMQAAMTKTLADLWKTRTPASIVKTPAEAVILASIVEKETGKPAERRMVAGVYTNRLRQNIKLDADPTVIYPYTKGRPLGRRILRSQLQALNGYNTYSRIGLPVGPIANPGRASIAAVLDPAPTKALYFVADGTGGHVFADTLAQHNANVAKWFAIRRARGEM